MIKGNIARDQNNPQREESLENYNNKPTKENLSNDPLQVNAAIVNPYTETMSCGVENTPVEKLGGVSPAKSNKNMSHLTGPTLLAISTTINPRDSTYAEIVTLSDTPLTENRLEARNIETDVVDNEYIMMTRDTTIRRNVTKLPQLPTERFMSENKLEAANIETGVVADNEYSIMTRDTTLKGNHTELPELPKQVHNVRPRPPSYVMMKPIGKEGKMQAATADLPLEPPSVTPPSLPTMLEEPKNVYSLADDETKVEIEIVEDEAYAEIGQVWDQKSANKIDDKDLNLGENKGNEKPMKMKVGYSVVKKRSKREDMK